MNATTARRLLSLAALYGLAVLLSPARAQEFVVEPIVEEPISGADAAVFSQGELDQLLAPVALYPDALLSQVLVASTYPLEVVEAARWSRANASLDGEAAVAAVAEQDWDPSVKSLVAFPDLLARMDEDLEWTRRLGEAMLLQESDVMDSIQFLRARAEETGTLEDTEHVRVVREERTIVIEPARERVVYVPYYDTRVVYGPWWHPAYPPVYWARPPYYSYASTGIYWSSGIHISAGFFFTDFYWPHRSVVVVHKPRYYYPPHHYYPRHHYYVPGQRWKHDPRHRRHVHYRHHDLQKRYRQHVPPPSVRRTEQRIEQRASQPRNHRELQRPAVTQRLRGAEPSDRLERTAPQQRPPGGSRQAGPPARADRQARAGIQPPTRSAQRIERSLRAEPGQRFEAPSRVATRPRVERAAPPARVETRQRVERPARVETRQRIEPPARVETRQRVERPARVETPRASRPSQAAPAPAQSRSAAPARSGREYRPQSRSRSLAGGSRQSAGSRRPDVRRPN